MTTEAATSKTLIDVALRLARWNLAEPTHGVEEYEIHVAAGAAPALTADVRAGPYTGKEFATYALLVRGRVATDVEAKRTAKDAKLGQERGLQYAQHTQAMQRASTGGAEAADAP